MILVAKLVTDTLKTKRMLFSLLLQFAYQETSITGKAGLFKYVDSQASNVRVSLSL